MEQKSKNIFYLDPDYENFVPRKSRLKWESINGGNSKYAALMFSLNIHLAFLSVPLCLIVFASMGGHYDAEGIHTTFTVIGCERLSPESSQLQVTYSYTVDDATFNSTANSDVNMTCADFPLGSLIEGQYRLTKPEISRVTQDNFYSLIDDSNWGEVILITICVPLPISALGVIGHFWSSRRYHIFRTQGVLLDGELLNYYPERISSKGGGYIRVTIDYRYETPDGRLLEKRFIDTSAQRLLREMPQFLTPIKVLYANDKTVIML
jgi:hypothetical protein